MHFYCCNDAVPWLNEAKSRIFRCTVISKFSCVSSATCQPACRKTQFRYVFGSNFSHKECNWRLQYESVVPKRFIHCVLMIPFILHWPSLFFSKVSNSQKKVLITPGLYFRNYCITYLPRDISRDFNKCEHVNLRREWTRAVFEELYYTANSQKIADREKADYQEGLEKSRADNAARSRRIYMKNQERVVLTVQHKAVKVTITTWRRAAMIVLHGGLRGPVPAQYFIMY